jgi:hypothetical protein
MFSGSIRWRLAKGREIRDSMRSASRSRGSAEHPGRILFAGELESLDEVVGYGSLFVGAGVALAGG